MNSTLINKYLPMIEEGLKRYLPGTDCVQASVCEAMAYSLLDAGKRIRPVLLLEFCSLYGGDVNSALPFACALEMIHSYSLIHDDLPCMDDDDLRRGKPSCHKRFGEATALLAGDALLTNAFETALSDDSAAIPSGRRLRAVKLLANRAGVAGMIGGQVIDLESESKRVPVETLEQMDELKTGALISAACQLGCVLAGATDDMISSAGEYARCIGLAFQIVDDILDATSSSQALGKPVGSDLNNDKSTYVSLLGLEESRRLVDELTENAVAILRPLGEKAQALIDFTVDLSGRKN